MVFNVACKDQHTGFIIHQPKSIDSSGFHWASERPSGIASKSIDDGVVSKSINYGITPKSIGGGNIPKSIIDGLSPSCDNATNIKQFGSYLDNISPCNHAMLM